MRVQHYAEMAYCWFAFKWGGTLNFSLDQFTNSLWKILLIFLMFPVTEIQLFILCLQLVVVVKKSLHRASWSKVCVSTAAVIIPVHSGKWVEQSTTTGERSLCWGSHRADLPPECSWVGGFLQELTDEDLWCCVCTSLLCFPGRAGMAMAFKQTPPSIHPNPHSTKPWERSLSGVLVTHRGEQRSGRGLLHSSFGFTFNATSLRGPLNYMRNDLLGYYRYQASQPWFMLKQVISPLHSVLSLNLICSEAKVCSLSQSCLEKNISLLLSFCHTTEFPEPLQGRKSVKIQNLLN